MHYSDERCRWKRNHDYRRIIGTRAAPRAESVDRIERAAVRLLPIRADHAGRFTAEQQSESYRCRYRPGPVWKYLPVRIFQSHSIGHQSSGRREPRMSAIENVSRRGFMKGMVSAGGLVLSLRFLPATRWGGGVPQETNK